MPGAFEMGARRHSRSGDDMRDQCASAPSTLSDDKLLSATRDLVARSNEATAHLVAHLAEIDARKLYLEQAQPSMFAWCVAELGASEDVACNWIAVARASRGYPAVLDALREGKVHLTGLRMLSPHLTGEGHLALLEEAAGKSKRKIEEIVARIAPRPAVASSVRKLPSTRASGKENESGDRRPANGSAGIGTEATTPLPDASTASDGAESSPLSAPEKGRPDFGAQSLSLGGAPQPPHRPRAQDSVEPLSEEAYKVTFTASRRLRDKIRQAQDLLGHQVPGSDLAEIVERGLDLLIEDTKKKRFAAGRKPRSRKGRRHEGKGSATARKEPPEAGVEAEPRAAEGSALGKEARRSRYIPAEVRRAVFERDGEQCTFVDERGRRCPETRRLELDHAEGFARGAPHTVDSLRIRCRAHNLGSAERMYGRAFMEEKRAGKGSAPGRIGAASRERSRGSSSSSAPGRTGDVLWEEQSSQAT